MRASSQVLEAPRPVQPLSRDQVLRTPGLGWRRRLPAGHCLCQVLLYVKPTTKELFCNQYGFASFKIHTPCSLLTLRRVVRYLLYVSRTKQKADACLDFSHFFLLNFERDV
ncbi:hypothetical protein PVAP13_3NG172500 [Panicum virgatum]|uniref:Uncharacterized protein n=1 Tax=Panicum virgatum TaxID=38727 RepID=A0A8T0UHT6_PANVG|nr:hypothetical protein PVAP13_3NG172500 [Panicum virgatum]